MARIGLSLLRGGAAALRPSPLASTAGLAAPPLGARLTTTASPAPHPRRPLPHRSSTSSASSRRAYHAAPRSILGVARTTSTSSSSSSLDHRRWRPLHTASSAAGARRTLMHGAAAAMPMPAASAMPLSLWRRAMPAAHRPHDDQHQDYGDADAHGHLHRQQDDHGALELAPAASPSVRRRRALDADAAADVDAMASLSASKKALREKAFLQFDVGTAAYPHPKRMRTGSEDAFFTSRRTGSFVSTGVADGVASVRLKYGLDPSKFSRGLCDGAHHLSNERLAHYSLARLPTPAQMFDAAVDHVRANDVRGCATLTVLTLNGYLGENTPHDSVSGKPAGELSALSLGDSQFVVVHDKAITHKAYFQQHGFGHPYQIGHGDGLQNDPLDEAIRTRLPVHEGDTVIIGSDGLFDNVHDADILGLALESAELRRPANDLAMRLADFAYERSTDRDADTPYSLAASRHLDLPFTGGNRDDITVIVAKVHDLPPNPLV